MTPAYVHSRDPPGPATAPPSRWPSGRHPSRGGARTGASGSRFSRSPVRVSVPGGQADLTDDLADGPELLALGQPGDRLDHRVGRALAPQVSEQPPSIGGELARRQVPAELRPAGDLGGRHAPR